jgi:hypothetical protein
MIEPTAFAVSIALLLVCAVVWPKTSPKPAAVSIIVLLVCCAVVLIVALTLVAVSTAA